MLAIASLGLPVGTRTLQEAAAFAAQHPVRVWTDPLVFWALFFLFCFMWGRHLDRRDQARRAHAS